MIHQLFDFGAAEAVIDHSYNRNLLPLPIVVRSNIQERQLASKFFLLILSLVEPEVLHRSRLFCLVSKRKHGEWN